MSPMMHRLGKSEYGFTMAEVIIAMVVFVSAIIGISLMIMAGSGAVSKGSMENIATQLANKKIEDVKSLPFYTPWTGANQDIDDSYFNMAYKNDQKDAKGNYQQLTVLQDGTQSALNTNAYENYGKITGYGAYKRTTAIQYQTVTPTELTPTAMNGNWVPKSGGNTVVSPNFDMPKDNASPTPNKVRLMIVEVKVSYRPPNTAGGSTFEKTYTERATISDLMVTGGANNPILVIKSINPVEGNLNDTNFQMDITVQSEGLVGATLDVSLWFEGETDNTATSVTVINDTLIRCFFNLADHGAVTVRPGVYSLAVYWQDKGWKDTSFRNCFTVTAPSATFSTLSNHNWGHKGQSARPVVLNGTDFQYSTVNLQRGGIIIPATGTTVNGPGTQINCNFNLTSIAGQNEYWDIAITNRGGTTVSDTPAKRLLVNPTPVVTSVATIDAVGGTYNWGHSGMTARKVKYTGTYLYGFSAADTSTRTLGYTSYNTSAGTFVSGGTGENCGDDAGGGDTATLVVQYDLTSPVGATWVTANTSWSPTLTNYGGTASITIPAQKFLMNPTPVITSIATTSPGVCYAWAHSGQNARTVEIRGQYLYGFYNNGTETPQTIYGYLASPTGKQQVFMSYTGGYNTTGTGITCVSGPDGYEADPTNNAVRLTLNPSSAAGAGYVIMDQYWNTNVRNYGGTSTSPGSGTAGGQVYMNPKPVITAITPTVVGSYYDWGHLGLSTGRAVQIQGNYLYGLGDAGGALAKLTWGTNRAYATENAGSTASGTTETDSGIGEAFTITFVPNSGNTSTVLWTSPDSYWNVYVKNFGGTSDSDPTNVNTSGMYVFMNPHPTVAAITSTQTPTPGDSNSTVWTYRAQTSTLTTTITGTNLYALTASSAALKICYGAGATSTSYCNGTYTDLGCNYALNTSQTITTTFTPSTGSYANTTNSIYYEAYLKNYGGTVDTDSGGANTNQSVWMNPPPKITSWSGNPTTATTGSAAATGGGTKTLSGVYPYTGLSVTGNYIQGNIAPQVFVVESNTAPAVGTVTTPNANTASAQLSGSSSSETWANPNAAGTSISGLNILMYVNPSANYFYQWGTVNHVTDAVLNANGVGNYGYYVYITNPDLQHYMTNLSTKITHAQYSYTISAKQPNWATVSGGGTRYQDEEVIINSSGTATSNMFLAWDEWNGSAWNQVSTTNNWDLGVAGTPRTLRCRYRKKLYYGDDGSPNYAGFITGYTKNAWSKCDPPNYTLSGQNRYVLRLHSWSSYSIFGSTLGEVACTANVDFTNATTLYIYWSQPNGNNNGVDNTSAYCQGTQNGDHNNGQLSGSSTDVFGWRLNSQNVTGWGTGWLHLNSYCAASALGGNDTDVRIQSLYLE